jgi:outer membrane receptor protein involved in Fe transport
VAADRETVADAAGAAVSAFYQYTNHATQQANSGAFTLDAKAAYQLTKSVEAFVTIQNLTNLQYYDQGALQPGTPPELALPLAAAFGVRAAF